MQFLPSMFAGQVVSLFFRFCLGETSGFFSHTLTWLASALSLDLTVCVFNF